MKKLLTLAAGAAVTLCGGNAALAQQYTQTNLVSNASGVAAVTDSQLVVPWGISRASGGVWWVSDKGAGVSTLYNGAGVKQSLVVTIPPVDPTKVPTGLPSGTIFNSSPTDFVLTGGNAASFLFCTLDGGIAAWNANVAIAPGASAPSTHAIIVAKGKTGSSYTGLTSAFIDGKRFLYAANFNTGHVDVFDNAFHAVKLPSESPLEGFFEGERFPYENEPFVDNTLPPDFDPFNVQTIGNDIVVTYALHLKGNQVETDGPGLGFVDIFDSKGHLINRLQHGSWLNAPWGVALAPNDFGRFSHDLLIGQFSGGSNTESSGVIAAYDMSNGKFVGLLEDSTGKPISIKGLWSLSAGNVSPANDDPAKAPAAEVYFSAGNNTSGLFGYLSAVAADLSVGNDQ